MAANVMCNDFVNIHENDLMTTKPPDRDRVITIDMNLHYDKECFFHDTSRFTLFFAYAKNPFKEPLVHEHLNMNYGFLWEVDAFYNGNGNYLINIKYDDKIDIIYKYNVVEDKLSYFSSSNDTSFDKEKNSVSFRCIVDDDDDDDGGALWCIKAQCFVNKNTDVSPFS